MLHYDPYMPEIRSDPYPIYARLRRECPVYYVERFDAWALARFEDLWQASQDTEHYSARNGVSDLALLERKPSAMELLGSLDPPTHDLIRAAVFPRFGPKATRALLPRIREWAIEALERHRESGRIDAVRELAQPVAVRVSCAISGFPIQDADYLVDLVMRFFSREEGTDGMSPEGYAAQQETRAYLEALVRKRERSGSGGDDALGILLRTRDDRGPLDAERVAQHLTLFLIGATETFPKVFASGLRRLWQHPDQRRLLQGDPTLIPAALTEMLRYDMPTQWLGRTVCKDHEIHGHTLRTGQPVLFLYPSANRDEREFDDPDRFDVLRNPPRILSFGHGIHRCLGSFMARAEGTVLFEETLKRFPEYEVLSDELVWPATEFVQGYSHFPIAFGSG